MPLCFNISAVEKFISIYHCHGIGKKFPESTHIAYLLAPYFMETRILVETLESPTEATRSQSEGGGFFSSSRLPLPPTVPMAAAGWLRMAACSRQDKRDER